MADSIQDNVSKYSASKTKKGLSNIQIYDSVINYDSLSPNQPRYIRFADGSQEFVDVREFSDTGSVFDINKVVINAKFLPKEDVYGTYLPKSSEGKTYNTEGVMDLIKNGKTDKSPLFLVYNGKLHRLGLSTYVVKDAVNSGEKYYTDTDGNLVNKKAVNPPAYKRSESGIGKIIEDIMQSKDNKVHVDFMGYAVGEEGTVDNGYYSDQELYTRDGVLYAKKSNNEKATEENSFELGSILTSQNLNLKCIVDKSKDQEYKTTINGKKVTIILGKDEKSVEIQYPGKTYVFVKPNENGTYPTIKNKKCYPIEDVKLSYNEVTKELNLGIQLTTKENFKQKETEESEEKKEDESSETSKKDKLKQYIVNPTTRKIDAIKSINTDSTAKLSDLAGFELKTEYSLEKENLQIFEKSKIYARDNDNKPILEADVILTKKPDDDTGKVEDVYETTKLKESLGSSTEKLSETQTEINQIIEDINKYTALLQHSDNKEEHLAQIANLQKVLQTKKESLAKLKKTTGFDEIDKIIDDFQKNFFETFYFDKDNNLHEITDGKTIENSIWSKSIDYSGIIGSDSVSVAKRKNDPNGKLIVKERDHLPGLKEALSVIGGTAVQLTFSSGIFAFVLAPITLPIAATAGLAYGAIRIWDKVSVLGLQSKLNRLKPQDIVKKDRKSIEKQTKIELTKAAKARDQEIDRINKYGKTREEKQKLIQEAWDKYARAEFECKRRLDVFDEMIVSSKYSTKDKSITDANLLGRAYDKQRRKDIMKGKTYESENKKLIEAKEKELKDIVKQLNKLKRNKKLTEDSAKTELFNALDVRRTKLEKEIEFLKKYKRYDVDTVAKIIDLEAKMKEAKNQEERKQINEKKDELLNEFEINNAPYDKRMSYFKKTRQYKMANDETRKKLEEDFEKKLKDDLNEPKENVPIGADPKTKSKLSKKLDKISQLSNARKKVLDDLAINMETSTQIGAKTAKEHVIETANVEDIKDELKNQKNKSLENAKKFVTKKEEEINNSADIIKDPEKTAEECNNEIDKQVASVENSSDIRDEFNKENKQKVAENKSIIKDIGDFNTRIYLNANFDVFTQLYAKMHNVEGFYSPIATTEEKQIALMNQLTATTLEKRIEIIEEIRASEKYISSTQKAIAQQVKQKFGATPEFKPNDLKKQANEFYKMIKRAHDDTFVEGKLPNLTIGKGFNSVNYEKQALFLKVMDEAKMTPEEITKIVLGANDPNLKQKYLNAVNRYLRSLGLNEIKTQTKQTTTKQTPIVLGTNNTDPRRHEIF